MKNHPFWSIDGLWEIRPDDPAWVKWRSNGQTVPALGAAGTDHGATAAGGHADEKTVRAFTPDDRWLIGAFHGQTFEVDANRIAD